MFKYLISRFRLLPFCQFLSVAPICLLFSLSSPSSHAAAPSSNKFTPAQISEYRQWVGEMKSRSRGPFKQLRWFCNDSTIHSPKPYACSERGGGRQHGQWSDKTAQLRDAGF